MDTNYYRQYYTFERKHWWFRVRADILSKVIRKYVQGPQPLSILNAGAATGRTSEILENFGHVTSVEPDEDCCRFLREELNREVTEASVTEMPFANEVFDMVCVLDVIEHVEDDQAAIRELHRVNTADGWLVMTVPAYQWLWSAHDQVNHHYRRYTHKSIEKLLVENGYRVEYMSGFNFLLFPPIALYRLMSGLFRKKNKPARSDFEIPLFNKVSVFNRMFYAVFGLERSVVPPRKVPFGVSILLLARKC